mmetsp:Transcript_12236/g.39173  ORF Transcript_12236/g.39173 Transcript_12236/m.39173 type:complete len:277 (+) Transcript_12236:226-1056(+)
MVPTVDCPTGASYSVEGQRFRAVLDTGSPFLLVPGRLPASGCDDRWGCYADSTASVALGDATTEGFGGQDVGVEWRRGRLDFGDFSFSPINFGVVTSSVRKGGTSAIYLGLVRDRVPRVRPTLLEQTDIESFQFDFPRRRLTLARRPLLRQRDAIPLVDLRPLGAPVAQYACRVERLLVNRAEVPLSRPAVAVLDTGTTGLVLSDSLYQSDEERESGRESKSERREGETRTSKVPRPSAAARRCDEGRRGYRPHGARATRRSARLFAALPAERRGA